MKKNIVILSILTVACAFSNCTKYLTHDDPINVTDASWWKTETNATNALQSVYAGLPDGATGRQVMFLSSLCDAAVARQDTRGSYEIYGTGLQNSDWDVALHIWQDDYKDIRRANRFLENVDGCYMDSTLKARYKYEARAMRAYYHMELMLFFGSIPIVTTSLTPDQGDVARNTEQEVYDFIISELTECAGHLPDKYDNSEPWRISSGVCWALISRLALYYKHYDVARDAAKKVIDQGIYKLYRSSDPGINSYAELFSYAGELNNERVFFKDNGSSGAWTTFAPYGVGGETIISPTSTIVNTYETLQGKTLDELGPDSAAIYEKNPNFKNNRDPRLAATILYPGVNYLDDVLDPFDPTGNSSDLIGRQFSTATGFWNKKYLDAKDRYSSSRTLDFMIIRYAEVLLNYVESLEELDDWQNPDIVKYLNDIRNRAGMPPVDIAEYNTQAKMQTLIRRERTVELAFEGVRYYDVRRWGILGDVMNGQVYGAYDSYTGSPVKVEVRSNNPDRDLLWPIPRGELLANPMMKQNPGY